MLEMPYIQMVSAVNLKSQISRVFEKMKPWATSVDGIDLFKRLPTGERSQRRARGTTASSTGVAGSSAQAKFCFSVWRRYFFTVSGERKDYEGNAEIASPRRK